MLKDETKRLNKILYDSLPNSSSKQIKIDC